MESPLGGGSGSKLLGRKEKKQKQSDLSDIGVTNIDQVLAQAVGGDKTLEDSFERYYNKDLDLDEDQVPVVIYELNESAINFISQESYEKALILLQKAQTMLEQIQADQNPKDSFVFLLTLHNMAMCYQKLGILEDCAICLEACIGNLNSPYLQDYFNNPHIPSLRLKLLKYKCKTHMQICALLSQVHKHKEAVYHAREGIKIAHFLIRDLEQMSGFYTNELLQRKPLEEISIINNPRFSLLEKTAVKLQPILNCLRKKMAIEEDLVKMGSDKLKQSHEEPDADMKNLLGYLNQSEWIYSLNIGNIMQIAPLTMQDFMSASSLELELSREYVLEKLCFLAVSYFCMGTEYRFLHQLQEMLGEQIYSRRDSEYWHGKAVEIAISFLPSESPLVSHILMSYEKHHSPSNQVIPEDEHQDVQVRVVRQIKGVDSNKLQPIIRYHNDKDFRVAHIDIESMDYKQIINGKRRKTEYSIDIGDSELTEHQDESQRKTTTIKGHQQLDVDEVDDEEDDEADNSQLQHQEDKFEPPKYYSLIEEVNTGNLNLGSIDSNSEFVSNPVNNKNTRKLKKIQEDDSQFNQSQSVLNESALMDTSTNMGEEQRRAKSSLGENSATRLRNKLMGAQKFNNTNSNQMVVMQQLRGQSSSAMARLHPQQIQPPIQQSISNNPSSVLRNITSSSSGLVEHQTMPKNKSNLESINAEEDLDLVRAQRQQLANGNQRRFKNNNQDLNISVEHHGQSLNQSISQGTTKQRNESKRQNSTTSREKNAANRAPITDIRQKKQSSTINIDDLPAPSMKHSIDPNNPLLTNIRQGTGKFNDLNSSIERDTQQRLNQSAINNTTSSLNTSIHQIPSSKRSGKQPSSKGRVTTDTAKQKLFQQQQMQQIMNLMGTQTSAEGILQMMKKREKLNNSALATKQPPIQEPQFMGKLYSQKRTPTAGAGMGNNQLQQSKKSGSATKTTKEKNMKFAAFTQDNWNSANMEMQKMLQLENIKKGLQRKSSKENSSGKAGMINNLVFTQAMVDQDDIIVNRQQRGQAPPQFIQSSTQYETWLQYQNQKGKQSMAGPMTGFDLQSITNNRKLQ